MDNYFEKRFGKRYIEYEGKKLLTLNPSIFNVYKSLFTRTKNVNNTDLLIIKNGFPTLYKLRSEATIEEILNTQKNTSLKDYLKRKEFDFILSMELRECMTCSNCFKQRTKMAILTSIMMDNNLMKISVNDNEQFLNNRIMKYIDNRYNLLGRHYINIKEGKIKIWRN